MIIDKIYKICFNVKYSQQAKIMKQTTQALGEKSRNKLAAKLVRTILDAYQQKRLSYFQMKKAAAYILAHIDQVQTQDQLLYFLENLAGYWPVFQAALLVAKAESNKTKEQEEINNLSNYIQNLTKQPTEQQ